MKVTPPIRIKHAVRRVMQHAGYDVMPAGGVYAARRRDELRAQAVTVVLDVGASTGAYAVEIRQGGFSGRIESFEPQAGSFAQLEASSSTDPLWHVHRVALGRDDATAPLHISGLPEASSLRSMSRRHEDAVPDSALIGNTDVRVARLDTLWPTLTIPTGQPLLLKLDVQGSELDVLAGTGELLGDVVVLEAELSLVELYDGQPLMHEFVDLVRASGLALIALEPAFADPRTGELLQLNGLFRRR